MTWLRRTLDQLFTEPSESAARFSPPSHLVDLEGQRRLEIEIEARRGMRGL